MRSFFTASLSISGSILRSDSIICEHNVCFHFKSQSSGGLIHIDFNSSSLIGRHICANSLRLGPIIPLVWANLWANGSFFLILKVIMGGTEGQLVNIYATLILIFSIFKSKSSELKGP